MKTVKALIIISLITIPSAANAWNADNHRAICKAAGVDIPEVCTYLDKVRTVTSIDEGKKVAPWYKIPKSLENAIRKVDYYSNTYAWHWMNVPVDDGAFDDFVAAKRTKYNDPRKGFDITGGHLVAFDWLVDRKESLSIMEINFLYHVAADLTQPMHTHAYDSYNKKNHKASDGVKLDLSKCQVSHIKDIEQYAYQAARDGWEQARHNDVYDWNTQSVRSFYTEQGCKAVNIIYNIRTQGGQK